jgi:hypothetical protein
MKLVFHVPDDISRHLPSIRAAFGRLDAETGGTSKDCAQLVIDVLDTPPDVEDDETAEEYYRQTLAALSVYLGQRFGAFVPLGSALPASLFTRSEADEEEAPAPAPTPIHRESSL